MISRESSPKIRWLCVFLLIIGCASAVKNTQPLAKNESTSKPIGFRLPPTSGNIDDYFNPESLQVSMSMNDTTIAGTVFHSPRIWFIIVDDPEDPGNFTRAVNVGAIEYANSNGIEYETTHAIYGTVQGEPYIASVNKREKSKIGMIDLSYHAVKKRGKAPSEKQRQLFKALYKAALAKSR